MYIEFEWDPEKAASNERKHGVSFETASRVFMDPFALSHVQGEEGGEERWRTLGLVEGFMLVLVVHTVREASEPEPDQSEAGQGATVEIIRIISARVADRSERKSYERQTR